ncbi:MAG: DUF1670 domain-containing protein [Chloroflexi bacterium]|nr:DUF1670 domain-containing protein [Chloroflexota bacterium]
MRLNEIEVLTTLGLVQADGAQWEVAWNTLSQARQAAAELGDKRLLGEAVFGLASIGARMGQHARAREAADFYLVEYARLGGDPDATYGRWIRALSGNLYVLAGDLANAARTFAELQDWIATETTGRPSVTALDGVGRLALAQNDPRRAIAPLARAASIWEKIGGDVAPVLLHALAAHRAGETNAARASLAIAETALQTGDVTQHNALLYYLRFQLFGSLSDLQTARDEIERQAARFTNPQWRSDFENLALHREIEQCWQSHHPGRIFRLPRAGAPLGKTLSAADYVQVRWTVDAGQSDADVLRRTGKAALRQFRLRRLLDEAHAQGAAPTDADLARALGVNRRTILRDMAALRATGQATPTRRRKQ